MEGTTAAGGVGVFLRADIADGGVGVVLGGVALGGVGDLCGDVIVVVFVLGETINAVAGGRFELTLCEVTGAELTLSEAMLVFTTTGVEIVVLGADTEPVVDTWVDGSESTFVSCLSSLNLVKTDPGRTTFGGHGGGDSASDPGMACITFCTDSVKLRWNSGDIIGWAGV